MPKPEIIGSMRSTYTRVVRMVCEEKGIEYVLTETAAGRAGNPRHPSFRQNAGAAPRRCRALRIEGHRHLSRSQLSGSVSVPVRSASRRAHRAMGLARQHGDGSHPDPDLSAHLYLPPGPADGKPDRKAIEARMPALREQIGVLDQAVAATGYLVGDRFTFADINLLPILFHVRQFPEGAEALAAAHHLAGYYDRHATRPSFKSTIPPPGPPSRVKPG